MIQRIKQVNQRYLANAKCVYKKCSDSLRKDKSRKWLVILEKMDSTITNEDRQTFNPLTAKFRASELKVVKIINLNDPTKIIRYLVNEFNGTKTKYETGKVVRSDAFVEDATVCSHGIHYFKTIEPAIFYESVPTNYTGHYMSWYDNGQKHKECEYLGGVMSGQWVEWYDNGMARRRGEYLNGKMSGRWQSWHSNGRTWQKYEYLEGKLFGSWNEWYDNGQIHKKGDFLEGNATGRWEEWGTNGKKIMECEYLDGTATGHSQEWYLNGQKRLEGKYLKDKKIGKWMLWHENGQKMLECEILEDKPTGPLKLWHKNGHKASVGDFAKIMNFEDDV